MLETDNWEGLTLVVNYNRSNRSLPDATGLMITNCFWRKRSNHRARLGSLCGCQGEPTPSCFWNNQVPPLTYRRRVFQATLTGRRCLLVSTGIQRCIVDVVNFTAEHFIAVSSYILMFFSLLLTPTEIPFQPCNSIDL